MTSLHRPLTGRIRSVRLSSSSDRNSIKTHGLQLTTRRTFLWWWKRSPIDWSSNLDDSFQRHLLRKQRVLRYKYSKALQPQQSWDREPSHNAQRPTWGRQNPFASDVNDGKNASSNHPSLHSVPEHRTRGQETFDEFASLKAHIDKDPFEAVFGRRLTSNQKLSDNSWSSFSWVFASEPSKEDRTVSQDSVASNASPISRVNSNLSSDGRNPRESTKGSSNIDNKPNPQTSKPLSAPINSLDQGDVYDFDPISMRKVLKSKPAPDAFAKPSKSLFDPLFAEKEVGIAVKPYKPHRVFGHTAKPSSQKESSKPKGTNSRAVNSGGETSRLAELRKLKATTLGNSIDTAAEYHGKWIPAREVADEDSERKLVAKPLDDESPLFSGSTYEAKSDEILKATRRSTQDWLGREGFGRKSQSGLRGTDQNDGSRTENGPKPAQTRLQPSLDRIKSTPKASNTLEPSLDRWTAPTKKTTPPQSSRPVLGPYNTQESTSEDLDLLRPSDVRASTRFARRSKQDSDQTQNERRQKLEHDFESRQKDDDGLSVVFPNSIMESSKKISESLNNLWHRVRAQPKTWLAQTVQSLGSIQDSVLDKPAQSISHEKRKAPVTEVQTAPNVQESAVSSMQTFTQSEEVLNAEQQSKARTLELRKSTLELRRLETELKAKENALAQRLKATYEDEYGPITASHRQSKGLGSIEDAAAKVDEAIQSTDRILRCTLLTMSEVCLMDAKATHKQVVEQLKVARAHLDAFNATLPPLASVMGTNSQKVLAKREEGVAQDDIVKTQAVENKQTYSTAPDIPTNRSSLLLKVLYDSPTLNLNISGNPLSTLRTANTEARSLHPEGIVSQLDNPTRFLPYLADMDKKGYKLVSGTRDAVLFMKLKTTTDSPTASTRLGHVVTGDWTKPSSSPSQQSTAIEVVVESIAPKASSPNVQRAEEVLSDSGQRDVGDGVSPRSSSSVVRRQEDVFSGSAPKWHEEGGSSGDSSSNQDGPEHSWFKKTVKRVFLAGTLTAVLAYSIGVVAERAGAQVQDGRPRRSGRPGIYSTENSQ